MVRVRELSMLIWYYERTFSRSPILLKTWNYPRCWLDEMSRETHKKVPRSCEQNNTLNKFFPTASLNFSFQRLSKLIFSRLTYYISHWLSKNLATVYATVYATVWNLPYSNYSFLLIVFPLHLAVLKSKSMYYFETNKMRNLAQFNSKPWLF